MIDLLEFSLAMVGSFVIARFVTVSVLNKLFGKRNSKGDK